MEVMSHLKRLILPRSCLIYIWRMGKQNEIMMKNCKKCERELPMNTDYFFSKKDTVDGYTNKCKECQGYKFTKYFKLIEGEMFCKKCDRILPHNDEHFPIDKTAKNGLRNVCYECKGSSFGKRKPKPDLWSKKEDSLLKEVYPDNLNRDIIHMFPNRTDKAIIDRAAILGISKSEIALEKRYEAQSEFMMQNSSWIGRPKTESEKENLSILMKKRWKENSEEMLNNVQYERSGEHREYLSRIRTEAGLWKGENNPRFIKPLNGSDNGRWLGGITPILLWLRNQIGDWKKESMEHHNYTCVLTGRNFDEIHHLHSFKKIVRETLDSINFDYAKTLENLSDGELEILRESIIKTNNKYGYGVCLTKEVHKLFHDTYGYGENSPEQFEEFSLRFGNSEFNIKIHK